MHPGRDDWNWAKRKCERDPTKREVEEAMEEAEDTDPFFDELAELLCSDEFTEALEREREKHEPQE